MVVVPFMQTNAIENCFEFASSTSIHINKSMKSFSQEMQILVAIEQHSQNWTTPKLQPNNDKFELIEMLPYLFSIE